MMAIPPIQIKDLDTKVNEATDRRAKIRELIQRMREMYPEEEEKETETSTSMSEVERRSRIARGSSEDIKAILDAAGVASEEIAKMGDQTGENTPLTEYDMWRENVEKLVDVFFMAKQIGVNLPDLQEFIRWGIDKDNKDQLEGFKKQLETMAKMKNAQGQQQQQQQQMPPQETK